MVKSKRVNLKKILADADMRRKLMVSTIQATQAREGIDTTKDQADRAYYVVTEGEKAAFFDLVPFLADRKSETDRRHEMFVQSLNEVAEGVRFDVPRRDFSAIEGLPLAYQRLGLVSHIFRDNPSLDPGWTTSVQGLATAADPQFLRHWWEVLEDMIGKGKPWVPFAKGGEFCRFYADVYLVVKWTDPTIERMKEIGRVQNVDYYFRAGLTWPLAAGSFNIRWMPGGCIFGHKGPAVFGKAEGSEALLCGVLNSALAEYVMKGLVSRRRMGARWEVGVVKRLPVPHPTSKQQETIGGHAVDIHDHKSSWDSGNEINTRFGAPWLVREDVVDSDARIPSRLDRLAEFESLQEARIKVLYSEIDQEVYRLYGLPGKTIKLIEENLGQRPSEVIWPQMAGRTLEQKRMEHVCRLLSYMVKRVVESDEDGIVSLTSINGEQALIDLVRKELSELMPGHDINGIEAEIANELKRKVKGYRQANDITQWLEDVFFSYHCALYRKRPIFWHISSSQGKAASAFSALVHYHRFDKDGMAKLRGRYLKEAIQSFRREAGLASQEDRTEDRQDWLARIEETELLDQKLQQIQEGYFEGTDGGEKDFRILTPWKSAEERPKGWEPDVDDGVFVNIAPLQRAGVLRISKVV